MISIARIQSHSLKGGLGISHTNQGISTAHVDHLQPLGSMGNLRGCRSVPTLSRQAMLRRRYDDPRNYTLITTR